MTLIVGGAHQGKTEYLQTAYGIFPQQCATTFAQAKNAPAFVGLHQAVRQALSQEQDPFEQLDTVLSCNPNIIIVCDEVGCGVVPIQREQRQWRETVGRMCCLLAERADSVQRVFCGMAMRLK